MTDQWIDVKDQVPGSETTVLCLGRDGRLFIEKCPEWFNGMMSCLNQ